MVQAVPSQVARRATPNERQCPRPVGASRRPATPGSLGPVRFCLRCGRRRHRAVGRRRARPQDVGAAHQGGGAGGGHFYDIATAAAIRDHISSEVGETLDVVARNVTLEVTIAPDVRVETLGAFESHDGEGRTVVELGDLVSEQQVDVPLRVFFQFGEIGDSMTAVFTLSDRDGVLDGAGDRLAWEYADDRANDAQERDVEVDRLVAGVFAARARRQAVELNRRGDYEAASRALRATAKKIRAYAGKDSELRAIVDG